MGKRTIAELKNIDVTTLNSYYGLEKWYNSMVTKEVSELNLRDVSTMLRQDVYVDIALPIAWNIICESPFAGEMWDGQLLELLLGYLDGHATALDSIKGNVFFEDIDEKIEEHKWDDEARKVQYKECVDRLACLVKDFY